VIASVATGAASPEAVVVAPAGGAGGVVASDGPQRLAPRDEPVSVVDGDLLGQVALQPCHDHLPVSG
jgi:hypothetical protein